MTTLKIEMDRGRGWEVRSEGEFHGTIEDVVKALPAYAIQYIHRAKLDDVLVAIAAPKSKLRVAR